MNKEFLFIGGPFDGTYKVVPDRPVVDVLEYPRSISQYYMDAYDLPDPQDIVYKRHVYVRQEICFRGGNKFFMLHEADKDLSFEILATRFLFARAV